MELTQALQRFDEILKRNESVLRLVEDVSNAIVRYVDWDDPELNEQRPHQRRVCQELLPAIYGCFYLLWTLSEGKLGSYPTLQQCALSNPFCKLRGSQRRQQQPLMAGGQNLLHL